LSDSEPEKTPVSHEDLTLASLVSKAAVTIEMPAPEDPAVRDHRLREEARDNGLRRFQHTASLVLGWSVVLAVGIAAARVAFDNAPEHAAVASWGRTILGTLVGSLGGYVIGRKS